MFKHDCDPLALLSAVAASGCGWRSESAGGLGEWVRPLFSGRGVKRGLFTGHSKQAAVAGVALPS